MGKLGYQRTKATLTLVVLMSVSFSHVEAFEFSFLGIKDPVHEKFSKLALRCLIENPEVEFADCESFVPKSKARKFQTSINNFGWLTTKNISNAVKWPDDPVRELRPYKILKMPVWLAHMSLKKCKNLKGGLKHGLRCSSHYGPAQFLHSMEFQKGEPIENTHSAILDWIEYSYLVASNEKEGENYFLQKNYCEFFQNRKSSYFRDVMYPNNGQDFPCNQTDETPWLVGTPYSFSCSIGIANCMSYKGENDKRIRLAALGAILHTIQDSYAKGHTHRGGESDDQINLYDCTPIKRFQVYGEQNTKRHGQADQTPLAGSSCSDAKINQTSIHGPITASSHILRLFSAGKPAIEVREYLAKHVFVIDHENAANADTTDYFKK